MNAADMTPELYAYLDAAPEGTSSAVACIRKYRDRLGLAGARSKASNLYTSATVNAAAEYLAMEDAVRAERAAKTSSAKRATRELPEMFQVGGDDESMMLEREMTDYDYRTYGRY